MRAKKLFGYTIPFNPVSDYCWYASIHDCGCVINIKMQPIYIESVVPTRKLRINYWKISLDIFDGLIEDNPESSTILKVVASGDNLKLAKKRLIEEINGKQNKKVQKALLRICERAK